MLEGVDDGSMSFSNIQFDEMIIFDHDNFCGVSLGAYRKQISLPDLDDLHTALDILHFASGGVDKIHALLRSPSCRCLRLDVVPIA